MGRGRTVSLMVAIPPRSVSRRSSWTCLVVIAACVGCSSAPDLPPMAGAQPVVPVPNDSAAQSCADGEQRPCSKPLSQQGSTISCYYGTQTCSGGVWSDCAQGTVVLQAAPRRGDRIAASISTPQPCQDNPCDPSCQKYVEVPGAGLTAQVNTTTVWLTGSLGGLPADVQQLVSKPNCETAADCQVESTLRQCRHGPKLLPRQVPEWSGAR